MLGLSPRHHVLRSRGDVRGNRVAPKDLADRLRERVLVRGLALRAGEHVRVEDVRFAHDAVGRVLGRRGPRACHEPCQDIAGRLDAAAKESAARDAGPDDVLDGLSARAVAGRYFLVIWRVGRFVGRLRQRLRAAHRCGCAQNAQPFKRDCHRRDIVRIGSPRRQAAEDAARGAPPGLRRGLVPSLGADRGLRDLHRPLVDVARGHVLKRQRLAGRVRARLHPRGHGVGDVEHIRRRGPQKVRVRLLGRIPRLFPGRRRPLGFGQDSPRQLARDHSLA